MKLHFESKETFGEACVQGRRLHHLLSCLFGKCRKFQRVLLIIIYKYV